VIDPTLFFMTNASRQNFRVRKNKAAPASIFKAESKRPDTQCNAERFEQFQQ
jgi:hypothetical protein